MAEHFKNAGQQCRVEDHQRRLDFRFDCAHLIESNTTCIGMLKYIENNDQIKIVQLQIHPDFQGQGFGSQVLDHIIKLAGTRTISLTVLKQNPAFRLYQRKGFKKIDEDEYEHHMLRT